MPTPLESSRQSAEWNTTATITLVLVAPVWKSQPWYLILLEMLVHFPILLPHTENLIIPTHPEGVPAVLPQLVAWLILGNVSKTKKFGGGYRVAAHIMVTEVFQIL